MAKSPAYNVTVEGTNNNITEYVTGVSYEDCILEDDLITINCEGANKSIVSKGWFNIGQGLNFTLGFIGGNQSQKKYCIIKMPSFSYVGDNKVNITLKCTDTGFTTKKASTNAVYQNKTASQIAADIAKQFGLQTDIENTTTVYPNMPVGNKNYLTFLQELAAKEGSDKASKKGPLLVYVTGKVLHFKHRDLDQESSRNFVWQDGNGVMKSFDVDYDEDASNIALGLTANTIDINTGKAIKSSTAPGDTKESNTGKNAPYVRTIDGVLLTGKQISVPGTKDEIDAKAAGALKNALNDMLKCVIEIELDPSITAGTIITVTGSVEPHDGNWYITKATHDVISSGGTTKLECTKNGTKAGIAIGKPKNSGDTNNSQGDQNGNTKSKVKVRSVKDGNLI